MNPLPPQAFTTETLSKAFAWLQSQPENIRALAANPELLVSLYLKAKLNGNQALERPSIQNFKNELKSLAGMMGEFEGNGNPISTMNPQSSPQGGSFQPQSQLPAAGTPNWKTERKVDSSSQNGMELDQRSLLVLAEVKEQLNLSTEGEALRMLIQLGFKALQKL